MNRRGFILGLLCGPIVGAAAVAKAALPVKTFAPIEEWTFASYGNRVFAMTGDGFYVMSYVGPPQRISWSAQNDPENWSAPEHHFNSGRPRPKATVNPSVAMPPAVAPTQPAAPSSYTNGRLGRLERSEPAATSASGTCAGSDSILRGR